MIARFLAIGLLAFGSADGYLRVSPGGSVVVNVLTGKPLPTWCGRKCNCGFGETQTIETEKGERVAGYVPPSGASCSCAEVYRCDPAEVGAPSGAPALRICPGWGSSVIQTSTQPL